MSERKETGAKPDKPKKEYIYRMNQGIADAVKMGVPEKYVEEVMRKFIPEPEEEEEEEEGKKSKKKSTEEFARRQAVEFVDEN